ncbi:C25 family cysteine peptidase [Fibrobacterota bacterium]
MAFAILHVAIPVSGMSVETMEDRRGRLHLQVEAPDIRVVTEGRGIVVECEGCRSSLLEGEPNLPYYVFNVVSSEKEPVVTVKELSHSLHKIPKGLEPVPKYEVPSRPVYEKNNLFYRRARVLQARIGELRYMRGVPIRTIMIPLAAWDDNAKSLRLIKKMRVSLVFSDTQASPTTIHLPEAYRRLIKNPVGGRYHVLKGAAGGLGKLSRLAGQTDIGPLLVKIKIGDREVETFLEDRMYSLSYETLGEAGPGEESRNLIVGSVPDNIKMYTGTHGTLPAAMDSLSNAGNLREIPIEVLDNNLNQTFDEGDEIRFFGHGTSVWRSLPESDTVGTPVNYEFQTNPYSFEQVYFLDFSGGGGKGLRLQNLEGMPNTSETVASSWNYLRAEKEMGIGHCNASGHYDIAMGKIWHWYLITDEENVCRTTSTQRVLTGSQLDLPGGSLPGYLSGTPLYLGFFTTVDFTSAGKQNFSVVFDSDSASYLAGINVPNGNYFLYDGTFDPENFRFNKVVWQGSRTELGFDGYSVIYMKEHSYSGRPFWIYPVAFGSPRTYQIEDDGTGLQGLKLADGVAVGRIVLSSDQTFSDSAVRDGDIRYFFFKEKDIERVSVSQIEIDTVPDNSLAMRNLVTGDGKNPEYLIIAPKAFLNSAFELKKHREDPARIKPLRTSVVRVEDIYRNYSSGRISPVAIRDFIRWACHGWGLLTRPDSILKYVTLFGDGYFNYRKIHAENELGLNFIPPHEDGKISTDDFFGYLDREDDVNTNSSELDVAIGRITVNDVEEAGAFVEKVKAYESQGNAGPWRNRIISAADDDRQRLAVDPISHGHTNDAEAIIQKILDHEPGKIKDNMYLLNYEHNYAYSKPEAARDLMNKINRGALILNYVGHGSWDVWADEGLMVMSTALPKLANKDNLPLITSFSCTVGRFELTESDCMSEALISKPQAGAIATVSATRESYAQPNVQLAKNFFESLFARSPEGFFPTVGDALIMAKVMTSNKKNNLKYILFGEPVVQIRKLNLDINLTQAPDTIKSLDCGTIRGKVSGGSGSGFVNLQLFGASYIRKHDGLEGTSRNTHDQFITEQGDILFSVTAPYEDGSFSMNYMFKERLPFGDTAAVMKVFAWDGSEELEGSTIKADLIVSGEANTCEVNDKEGPEIIVSGCERSQTSIVDFSGSIRLAKPYCLEVIVTDSTGGVSFANRPDEGTTLEVQKYSQGSAKPYDGLTQLQLSEDSFMRKTYKWNISDKMEEGKYLLKIRAQDGFGNLSMRNLEVELVEDAIFEVYHIFNVPNPLKGRGTCFYIGEIAEQGSGAFHEEPPVFTAEIKIFNQRGLLVKCLTEVKPREDIDRNDINSCRDRNAWWDGRDHWGNKLGNGLYFYEVKAVRTASSDMDGAGRMTSIKRNTLLISR